MPEERPSVRVLKPRRAAPADAVRPTRAEVNLAALRHNLRAVKRHAAGAKVWAVLKADGYGHGAPAVARTLERAGAEGFCVALLEEAVELRDAGIVAPILVMGGYYAGRARRRSLARDLTPVVYDVGADRRRSRLARARRRRSAPFARTSRSTRAWRASASRMAALAALRRRRSRDYPEVEISGLMTHLACADADGAARRRTRADGRASTRRRRSSRATAFARRVRHAANSAALFRGEARLDAVRPGIAIFGVSPRVADKRARRAICALVMRVRTRDRRRPRRSRPARPSATARSSARRARRASRRSRWATPTASRASLSNRGHVLVRGKRAPDRRRRLDGHVDDRRHRRPGRAAPRRGRRPRRAGRPARQGRDHRGRDRRPRPARSRGRS